MVTLHDNMSVSYHYVNHINIMYIKKYDSIYQGKHNYSWDFIIANDLI